MGDPAVWDPLRRELDRWHATGRTARLWLRDDDAVMPAAALERLLTLASRFDLPLTLAVIPSRTGIALASRLAEAALAVPVVHGWSHDNHAPPGGKKQELGPHRPRTIVLGELSEALRRMQALFGARMFPMLVPPWNRIDLGLLPALPGLGFRALSVFGPAHPSGLLPVINTHVDLIDWRGTRQCRPAADLAEDLTRELQRAYRDGEAIGLLSHHLIHDEAAWEFLEALLEFTCRHEACIWVSPVKLAGRATASGGPMAPRLPPS